MAGFETINVARGRGSDPQIAVLSRDGRLAVTWFEVFGGGNH